MFRMVNGDGYMIRVQSDTRIFKVDIHTLPVTLILRIETVCFLDTALLHGWTINVTTLTISYARVTSVSIYLFEVI